MKTPKIALESLPGLDTATGLFGSAAKATTSYSDAIIAIMVFVYDEQVPAAAT
ncbi:hypothetical protein [Altererythrobacter lutimaris]|uniref:Uncharacterized protein n=1 Tax=Altererythrobacter lutimaris TaxID=2743979 RepID=A0A850HCZ3_9SPHN|nr:hypothetical protein [Altererythrobacter lutimaris]NVE94538.1 hypothetical protein [Altererythrobacter lutimaris]